MPLDDFKFDPRMKAEVSDAVSKTDLSAGIRTGRERVFPAKGWAVSFSRLTRTEFRAIRDYFRANGSSVAVPWTPPGDATTIRVYMDRFQFSHLTASLHEIRMTLLHAPGIG